MRAAVLLLLLGQGVPQKYHPKPHAIQRQTKGDAQEVKPLSAPVQNSENSDRCELTTYKTREDYQPSQWWIIGITAIYTIGSLVTLGLIWKQNRSIQNTERAVLIPIWERWPRIAQGVNRESHSFEWKFKNCGKTPAFLKEVVAHLVLIDSLEDLPVVPDYSGAVTYNGDPLIPQQEMDRKLFFRNEGFQRFQHY